MTRQKKLINALLAVVLWLASLGLGLFDIDSSRRIIESIFARFWTKQYWAAVFVENLLTVVLALGLVVFLIITSEYHQKHSGERGSWKLFGQTLGIELLIPLVAFFIS